ncbi:MAG: hypothetical protein QXQ02_08210 [Halobacteria archaeon]
MDRRDFIFADIQQEKQNEELLRKAIDEGGLYIELVNSAGWKALLEDYINKRLSQDRFLSAKTEELADIRAEQRELFGLLRFIQRKIDQGQRALEMLKNSQNKEV